MNNCPDCQLIRRQNCIRYFIYLLTYTLGSIKLPATQLKAANTIYPHLEYIGDRPLEPDFFQVDSCGKC